MADLPSEPEPRGNGRQPTDGTPADGPARPRSEQPRLVDLFALGTSCAICIVGAGGIGYGLDSAFGTTPWLTFVGLAFGITSAILLAVARLRRYL